MNTFYGQLIRELSFELGLDNTFLALMRLIKQNIPADYIACNLIYKPTNSLFLLAEYNESQIRQLRELQNRNILSVIDPYYLNGKLDTIFLINDAHADSNLSSLFTVVDRKNRAILGTRLYNDQEYAYFLGLRSVHPNVFTKEHAQYLASLRKTLAELILHIFPVGTIIRQTDARRPLREETDVFAVLQQQKGMATVCRQIIEVAPTKANVLITGETGSGKEYVAEALFRMSRRRGRPFVKVNCGSIPESLLESELFGYEKGAFTGAIRDHPGFFEQANGGTIFLDEIGELSPMAQTKLLRVIESKEVQRIGSPKRLAVNFRLIAATNRDLESMAREGKFRLDLWYRLSAYVISIPPLRERLLDIPYLVSYHAGRLAEDLELAFMPRIGDTMMASLMHREWPGNIRELRNWLERALIHSRSAGSMVLIEPISAVLPVDRTGKSPSHFNELATLDEIEKQYIIHVLDICAWKVQGDGGAAEILGLKPNTLRSRMKKLGIPFMKKSLAMQFNHVRTQFD